MEPNRATRRRLIVAGGRLVAIATIVVVGLAVPPRAAGAGDPIDFPWLLTPVGDRVFFAIDDGTHGEELWVSDGSAAGTRLVRDIRPGSNGSQPRELAAVGDRLFFSAADASHGRELWVSDGTAAGTELVRDIAGGGGRDADPLNVTDVGGVAFFTAFTPRSGRELWSSDGTRSGTRMLIDLSPGDRNTFTYDLLPTSDSVYVGAAVQTRRSHVARAIRYRIGSGRVRTLWEGEVDSSDLERTPGGFSEVRGSVYFLTFPGYLWGGALYASDGTRFGTRQVAGSVTSRVVRAGRRAVFDVDGRELWRSNGRRASRVRRLGTYRDADQLTTFGDVALFVASDGPGGTTGVELWSTDGTVAGTDVLVDIDPPSSSLPQELTVVGDHVFFEADGPGSQGRELWRTDGTAGGTELVEDIADDGSSFPSSLTAVGDRLFFVANDGTHGFELWVSDGTPAGTHLVEDIVT